MKQKQPAVNITEKKIDNVTYVVTSECSSEATETMEKKLERILTRYASDVITDTENYQLKDGETLAMCGIVREHGLTTI